MKQSDMETGHTPEVDESKKIALYEEAVALLEDKLMATAGPDKVNRAGLSYNFQVNISALIEETCANNPEDGISLCKTAIQELAKLFEGEDMSNLTQEKKDSLLNKFMHSVKLKLAPLIIKKMERLKKTEFAQNYKDFFRDDKKDFMQYGEGSFLAILDDDVPAWFKTIDERQRYDQLRIDAIHDPEVAKFSKDIHDKAMREIRGEEE